MTKKTDVDNNSLESKPELAQPVATGSDVVAREPDSASHHPNFAADSSDPAPGSPGFIPTPPGPIANDPDISSAQVAPQSREAEQALLGAILRDNECFYDSISGRVSHIDFYLTEHQLIFTAMQSLFNRYKPVDLVTLAEELRARGSLDAARGSWYLIELNDNALKQTNVAAYVEIIVDRSISRQLIRAAGKISQSAFNSKGRTSQELLDAAEENIFAIASGRFQQSMEQFNPFLHQAMDQIKVRFNNKTLITGVPTAYPALDSITCGFQPSDLIILAARPSMGKTSLALNIAEHALISEKNKNKVKPVLMFSLEMPATTLLTRMLASMSQVNLQHMNTGKLSSDSMNSLEGSFSLLNDLPFFISDQSELTPSEMRSQARRVARTHGPVGLIIVDYLQLMNVGMRPEHRVAEVALISRNLKALAKEMNCPVLTLSQLNRNVDGRLDKRPMLSDIRDSGAVEQDADLILFIHRSDYYKTNREEQSGDAEIIIAKHRNGPTGIVKLKYRGEVTRFEPADVQRYDSSFIAH